MKTVLIITLSIGMRSFCGGCPEDSKPAGHEKNVIELSLGANVASAIERGNKALISRQHADDGSWGGDDVKVQSSHKSDYPVAISSLAYLALMATAPENKDALRARKRSLQFILDTIEDGKMKNTRDNTPKVHERNVWSQGFSMFVLSRLLEKQELDSATAEQVRSRLTDMVAALTKTQQADGGWTYDRGPSESFLTSTVLIGLGAAREVGIEIRFRERVDKLRDLEEGCHQPPYGIGTFYCFYGHFYLAQALQVVGEDTRSKYFPVLQQHFVSLQKSDGHWIDSRDHFGESYGTAMGLLVLSAPLWAK